MNKKQKLSVFLSFVLLSFIPAFKASAICPICTVAVGAGVGLSRWLGIDDTITGVWVGALTVSMSMWTVDWLAKKKKMFKGGALVILLAYYLLIVVPLYFTGIMGHPFNRLWGMDKLLLGILGGSIIFYLGTVAYEWLKKKNNGRAHFPFEKVVFPVVSVLIISLVFYFITK